MSFRKLAINDILKGALLAIVRSLFPAGIPTLSEYAQATGIAFSTLTRAAAWLGKILPGLFRGRRPGPPAAAQPEPPPSGRDEALTKLQELRTWLNTRTETDRNRCYDGEAKKRIADMAASIHDAGLLSYEEIAAGLGMAAKQLQRIREAVKQAGGRAPEPQSRRPKSSAHLAPVLQALIRQIEASADTRHPYGPNAIKAILEKRYVQQLEKHHGSATISATTVAKYMGPAPLQEPAPEHPRGSYVYPEPFQAVALDTSHYTFFGITFYMITVFELGGRLNLITRLFLRENTEAVISVLEGFLARYPGIEVAVIDRGTPYLNEEVKRLLEAHGRYRLVCPPETPTAKAAAERHFRTLKETLSRAVDAVFAEDPRWPPAQMAKALELGVAVFAAMYHRIPQDGIDGKSPAERAQEFDPVQAARRQAELFERALNAEPSDDYARHVHQLFQLPWDEKTTVDTLRVFPTPILRDLVEQVKAVMGPPIAAGIYDPLGFLAARARKLHIAARKEAYVQRWREAEAARQRESEVQERDHENEHPEAYVDDMLKTLVVSVRNNNGLGITSRFMREQLQRLAATMGRFFVHEIARLKARVGQLVENATVAARVVTILDEIAAEIRAG
jgi:hypothetical protein